MLGTVKIYTLRDYKKKEQEKHVNLVYITKEEKHHYACVKNMSRLFSTQINKSKNAKHICHNCQQPFKLKHTFEKHRLRYKTNYK